MQLQKIISGGQTGADRAALDAAIEYGLPHGGWIPKGRRTESGPLPDKYNLREMPTDSYPKRTEQNVIDSDGTLIICHGNMTGGTALTWQYADKHRRPRLHIDLTETLGYEAIKVSYAWIYGHKIKILNVAGPRASKDPDIYKAVKYVIKGVIVLSVAGAIPGDDLTEAYTKEAIIKLPLPPKTVDEVVERLLTELDSEHTVSYTHLTLPTN